MAEHEARTQDNYEASVTTAVKEILNGSIPRIVDSSQVIRKRGWTLDDQLYTLEEARSKSLSRGLGRVMGYDISSLSYGPKELMMYRTKFHEPSELFQIRVYQFKNNDLQVANTELSPEEARQLVDLDGVGHLVEELRYEFALKEHPATQEERDDFIEDLTTFKHADEIKF